MRAPESSATYKNSMNGNGELIHRYTFTKIFRPETKQAELFEEMVIIFHIKSKKVASYVDFLFPGRVL